jgi:glycosyltransferase involved in cell wall biosynthesis
MKICFYTENYYRGGLDTFLINLINAWPDAKDDLTLVCNGTHPGLDTIVEKTRRPLKIERYYRIFTTTIAQGQISSKWSQSFLARAFFVLTFRFFQYSIFFPWYVFTLMLFFRRSDFDRLMVVNGGYPASLLGRSTVIAWWLAGKRPLAVMNFHNSTTCPAWYHSFAENRIDALVIRSVSHIVSVSKDCLGSLNSRSAFLGCGKLSYIYNGIEDPTCLLKTAATTTENGSSPKRYCLMLATYENRKGHAYLLQAFQSVVKNFPDVQLQIYGHGRSHEKKQVANEVIRLKLENNVTLGDFTRQTATLLAGASVLVVPSQANESFGLTIIEAMAFGVPVVTTDVGGMPEVLGDSNAGYVCSRDNPFEFAAAIKKILGNPNLASTLGRNGRLAFESRFMATTMAKQYASIIKD